MEVRTSQILSECLEEDEISFAAVLNWNAQEIKTTKHGVDPQNVNRTAFIGGCESIAQTLKLGELDYSILSCKEGFLFGAPISSTHIFIMQAKNDTILGTLHMLFHRYLNKLRAIKSSSLKGENKS